MQGKQLAEPQKPVAITSVPQIHLNLQIHLHPENSPLTLSATSTSRGAAAGDLECVSESISPVMKTRKSSSHKNIPDKDLGSSKAKNWKYFLFGCGGNHSPDISPSHLASNADAIGSIGVPLRSCPMSKNNVYVPHIVDVCTNIVETKGLSSVGIYSIPGNKTAVSELSEQVNKADFSWDRCNTDARWENVDVVASLLKHFILSLPDGLFPCYFYINFIEADKKTGYVRLRELKELLESLPRHSYETMKHLIRHLNRVSKNCSVNLMDTKNLASILGPSIISTPNDTTPEIAFKDIEHQSRIVELFLTQYDYFFENGSTPDIANISGNITNAVASSATSAIAQSQEDQTKMLPHDVSKIERLTDGEQSSPSWKIFRIIPNLRRRKHSKRSAVSSDPYSAETVLSLDDNTSTSTSGNSLTDDSSYVIISSVSYLNEIIEHAAHCKNSLDVKVTASGSGGSGGNCKE